MYDICLIVSAWCIIGLLGVLLIFSGEIVCADIGIRNEWHPAGLAQLYTRKFALPKKHFPLIALQIRESAFVLLTMR